MENLIGQQFNNLKVLSLDCIKKTKWGTISYWVTQCDCGTIKSIRRDHLKLNKIKSCGCHRASLKTNFKHGESIDGKKSKEYSIWCGIKKRCFYKGDINYKNYGGRGISVCERWLKYENFLSDMGRCPLGCSIDRINVNGDYEPSNCKWATNKEQGNNKRNSLGIVFEGERLSRDEAMQKLKINRTELYQWLKNSKQVVWA